MSVFTGDISPHPQIKLLCVKMKRRQQLFRACGLFAVIGGLFLALPFLRSLQPTDEATNRYTLRIPLDAIPRDGYLEKPWQNYARLFITNREQLNVFWVPFQNDTYMLPDLSWKRPYIPCQDFRLIDDEFQCLKTEHDWMKERGRWRIDGSPVDKMFEPMQRMRYHISEGYLIVGVDA